MKVFIDTSAFYALLDRDDENHRKAKSTWSEFLAGERHLVTSNYVLVETFALLQSRLGIDAVRGFQVDVVPVVVVEFVTPDLHRLGLAGLLSASRRKLSLVDCVSFEVMRQSGITLAFTFDSHFKGQGFRLAP
jgi:predicted nucleic acid-binding protein